jgi:hypothetical protein
MKNQKIILVIASMIYLNSCCKVIIKSSQFIYNNTAQIIVFLPFKNGKVIENRKLTIKPNEKLYEAANFPADSLVVFFNDKYPVSHHFLNSKSINGIKFENRRNILNISNYTIERIKKSKCGSMDINTYFTFTEQDYLEAKAK